jgi:hypothetical protein
MATLCAPPWARPVVRGSRVVTIPRKEARLVAALGKARNAYSNGQGWKPRAGQSRAKTEADHILGAYGEYAVCEVFGLDWNVDPTVRARFDVGPLQVRTRSLQWHELYLYTDGSDCPDDPFVLVTAEFAPTCVVHGWTFGREAMVKRYRTNWGREDVFAVPQRDLHELAELPALFPELRLAPR